MPSLLTKISNSTDAQRITGSSTLFSNATFFAYSGFATNGVPFNNSGTYTYVGLESGKMFYGISPGSYFNQTMAARGKDDLMNYWVRGTGSDGIYVMYNLHG